MKKMSLVIVCLFSFVALHAQLRSETSECFELTSIVFRLAGADEYINNELKDYSESIDVYFSKFKNHPVVAYSKELRNQYGISYNAVASAASAIEVYKNGIRIKPGIVFSKVNGRIDERWTEKTLKKFVGLLNDFYVESNFLEFYNSHQDIYEIARQNLDTILEGIDIGWFESFFGESLSDPMIVASLSNGRNNYAFHIPDSDKEDGIVIGCGVDINGLPFYNPLTLWTVMHEFSHSFTNKRLDRIWVEMESSSNIIYSFLDKNSYHSAHDDPKIIMTEWLTNLCALIYFIENPVNRLDPKKLTAMTMNRGCIWMDRSVLFMKHFLKNRDIFPFIDDYMGQLVGFIDHTAEDFGTVQKEYENKTPYLVDVFPIQWSRVSADIDSIVFTFSKPMKTEVEGIEALEDKEVINIYTISDYTRWEDEYTYVIHLDATKIEKDQTYGIKLLSSYFISTEYYYLGNDYSYTFKTAQE